MKRTLFFLQDEQGEFTRPIVYTGSWVIHALHRVGEVLAQWGLDLTWWAEARLTEIESPERARRRGTERG
ncbi:MAG TPA: hypothetical protein VNM48_00455 [Chloroflexota bacterium]|nr:hypothetical protein [Chloroflexota bacterium]